MPNAITQQSAGLHRLAHTYEFTKMVHSHGLVLLFLSFFNIFPHGLKSINLDMHLNYWKEEREEAVFYDLV